METVQNYRCNSAQKLVSLGIIAAILASLFISVCVAQTSSTATLAKDFANPPVAAKPQVRFWTPAAAISEAGMRRDIDDLTKAGFGGVEVVGFNAPAGVSNEFAWGTEAWNRLMNIAASQAGKDGVTVDFANGPRWPIAMPGIKSADDPGALYELAYGSAVVQPGQSFSGIIPARRKVRPEGTTKVIAVLAYPMTADKVLDQSALMDLTPKVSIDRADNAKSTVEFTAPAGTNPWVIFTFWEQPAAQKVHGYYVVDHFSAAGEKAVNDYWEKVAFPAMGENAKYGRCLFNDSLEYAVTMEWTRGFQNFFKEQHGYDITPYLAFIGMATTFPADDIPGYRATEPNLAEKVNRDYFDTVTTLYVRNHLQPMEQMAQRHGWTVRYQIAYNKPMQIGTSAMAVGIPETEALGRSSMDMPRYMSGAVHMMGKPFYSIETSAEFQNAYGQTLEDLLWWNKRAWAGGVNIQRLHGESYSGEFDGPGSVSGQLPGQKWPGYSAFGLSVSNNWVRQTSPEALQQTLTYMARTNYVMQKTAKVDVAVFENKPDIYDDRSLTRADGESVYPDHGVLNANGFSYDFISAPMLDISQAVVRNGRLAPAGPAYKALIIHHEAGMTMHVVERLKQLAKAGFKVVFVGKPPNRNASHGDELRGNSDARIQKAIADLLRINGVATAADYSAVPATLRQLGVRADAEPATPVDVLTQHRSDASGDYYYLYNYNKIKMGAGGFGTRSPDRSLYPNIDRAGNLIPKTARFSLLGSGRPYELDAWTGKITAVPAFTNSAGRVEINVHLVGDEARIIALLTDAQAKRNGVTPAGIWAANSDAPDGSVAYADDGKLSVKATNNANYTVKLSTGQSASVGASDLQSAQTVQDWSLSINSIGPPSNGSILFTDSVWKQLGPFTLGATLKPWKDIDLSLEHVSGVGTYQGTFNLDRGWDEGCGAYIELGEVAGAFTVTINGTALRQLDQVNTIVDLGPYVKKGSNHVSVQVASTLYNAVVGTGKLYGLLGKNGEVRVIPYRVLPLEASEPH